MNASALRDVRSDIELFYSNVAFRYVIIKWLKSKTFLFKKKNKNIILGRRVEVIITESVSNGHKTCQKHRVHGCISATSKGEWLWDKYEIE